MTVEDVRAKIDLIRKTRDCEVAHSLEDSLLWEFVEHVAAEGAYSVGIAALLSEWSKESENDLRWYA